MARNPVVDHDKPLIWTPILCELLDLIFEGRKSRMQIAEHFGVNRGNIWKWVTHPDFQAKLAERRADLEASLGEHGTAYVTKESRIIALSEMAEQARIEFEARPLLQEKRQIGTDENGQPMYLINESFNRDAHDSFRQALADIAKELGHRVAKTEVTGKDGAPIAILDVTDEIRRRLVSIAESGSARAIPQIVDAGSSEDPGV